MTRIGYARVSSASQSYDEQARALRAAGCDVVRCEKESGASMTKRVELEIVLSFLRTGDALCVTRMDRLARSVRDLIDVADRVAAAGASLVVLDQGVDFGTAHGRMFLQILGAVAEFERTLIRERQASGIAAARRAGRSLGGRRATISRESIARLLAIDPPVAVSEIARRLEIGQASVYRIMTELQQRSEPA